MGTEINASVSSGVVEGLRGKTVEGSLSGVGEGGVETFSQEIGERKDWLWGRELLVGLGVVLMARVRVLVGLAEV